MSSPMATACGASACVLLHAAVTTAAAQRSAAMVRRQSTGGRASADRGIKPSRIVMRPESLPEVVGVGMGEDRHVLNHRPEGSAVEAADRVVRPLGDHRPRLQGLVIL